MPLRERAHVTVEFVGTLPFLVMALLLCVQALLLALSMTFAQVAVGRAARTPSARPPRIVSSVPAAWRTHAVITRSSDTVTVRLATPSVLPGLSLPRVSARAREVQR